MTVAEGDFVAIVGPSGCGKTSLLNLIGGLDRPDQGEISVQDRNLSTLNDRALSDFRNRTIGFIFQLNWLHPRLTAVENAMLPALISGMQMEEARHRASEQLRRVGLESYSRRFAAELSGGQVQRVAIARALVMSPPILLADEPTGNLDQNTGAEILTLVQRLNREEGLTVLLVTHEPAIRDFAKRSIRMDRGRLMDEPAAN